MNGIFSTTHTERRYFLGQFKEPLPFETAKNWFQSLGTEKGGVWFEGARYQKVITYALPHDTILKTILSTFRYQRCGESVFDYQYLCEFAVKIRKARKVV
jgi:hypothetical protein